MRAALYPNFSKKNALSCALEVCDVLHSSGIEVSISGEYADDFACKPYVIYEDIDEAVNTADLFIAIGGDGTILRCAKYLMGTDTKLLGINSGTLGFMAALEADQIDRLSLLASGDYQVTERMTVDVVIHGAEGDISYTAINEVSARSGSFKICDFDVYSDGYLVGKHRADGVLFSTPSGSTAYALSAGGPIIEPDIECIEMTLVCPHSLFSRSTIFSAKRTLRLTDTTARDDDSIVISVDGEVMGHIGHGESIEITRGRHDLKFIELIGNAFHESLCRKMCKPIK